MNYSFLIFRQIIIMFIYMAIGFFLYRKKLVTSSQSTGMAHLLIYVILPCVIVRSFCSPRTAAKMTALAQSFFWSGVLLALSMLIAALFFKKRPIDQFGAAFSNAGFMGIPLISAVLGAEAVFYVAGMISLLNILQWFYGQSLLTGQKCRPSLSVIAKNPLILSLFLGLVIFTFNLPIPEIAASCLNTIAGMNAPIAMIILGTYLAQTSFFSLFGKCSSYWVAAVRLLIISAASVLVLALVPSLTVEIKTALLIAACAPIGSNVAVYAQKLNQDYIYAVETVCLSTLFSLITMPLIIAIAGLSEVLL